MGVFNFVDDGSLPGCAVLKLSDGRKRSMSLWVEFITASGYLSARKIRSRFQTLVSKTQWEIWENVVGLWDDCGARAVLNKDPRMKQPGSFRRTTYAVHELANAIQLIIIKIRWGLFSMRLVSSHAFNQYNRTVKKDLLFGRALKNEEETLFYNWLPHLNAWTNTDAKIVTETTSWPIYVRLTKQRWWSWFKHSPLNSLENL